VADKGRKAIRRARDERKRSAARVRSEVRTPRSDGVVRKKEEKVMKSKSGRFLSALMAVMMVFSLFAAMPLTANASDPYFEWEVGVPVDQVF